MKNAHFTGCTGYTGLEQSVMVLNHNRIKQTDAIILFVRMIIAGKDLAESNF
ncbi:MAG: hypothetical protein H8E17_14865 [Deltaproteobacteria bacterium]|nr:hypothetical protein [Deltaproteobacteria bacterium]